MMVEVAVVDPLPMYARGLVATLGDAGYQACIPQNLLTWLPAIETPAVMMAVADAAAWSTVEEILRVRPDTVIVAVLSTLDVSAYAHAVTSGAVGILPRDASPATVCDVVRAALSGRSLVPVEVVRALAVGWAAEVPDRPLSDKEVDWLRWLAEGATVASVADRVGYSERMMFRLLADVYARLGVEGRTRAIMLARDNDWL